MFKHTFKSQCTYIDPMPNTHSSIHYSACRKNSQKTSDQRIFKPWVLLLFALLLLLTGCTNSSSPKTGVPTPTPPPFPSPSATWQATPGQLSPTIDGITQQVIQNISAHGWNPSAQIHGKVSGGLYINWQMNNPSHTNALKQGSDDVTSGSHDPQVDLFYLNALAEYHALHPQDHTYDGELQKALNQVLPEFARYNLPKGWIYFYLLRDGLLLQNAALVQAAHTASQNYYTRWYDPSVGMVYNRAHSPGVYDPEQSITCGAALIDAGIRWQQPAWVSAGESTIDKAIAAAWNAQYHMFYTTMTILPNNTQQITDPHTKPAAQGSIVEALVKAFNLTHNQRYLSVATQTLQGLFSSSLWDQQNGGFFFELNLQTGQLQNTYKETRSQEHALIGLYQYNQALARIGQKPILLAKQQQLITLLTTRCYQSTYHGYFYRMTPTFQIYTSKAGQGLGYEDFFTTEAMGLAMDSLQQTEFSYLSF